jgi:hypothetical protein
LSGPVAGGTKVGEQVVYPVADVVADPAYDVEGLS